MENQIQIQKLNTKGFFTRPCDQFTFQKFQKEEKEKVKSTSLDVPPPLGQSPIGRDVMDDQYFSTWDSIKNKDYDFIVIGSGFCGLAFVDEVIKQNPNAKILLLERGGFWLPDHFQNLPLTYKFTLGNKSETYPWTLKEATLNTDGRFVHGSSPFFGGRSAFWSAWSPQPTEQQLSKFPEALKNATKEEGFWERAREILHVRSADQIKDKLFDSPLQSKLFNLFENVIDKSQRVIHAPLSVGYDSTLLDFNKFSTPGPLLELLYDKDHKRRKTFNMLNHCVVEKLDIQNNLSVSIQVKHDNATKYLDVKNAKVILALGCIPATTLLFNSLEDNLLSKLAGKKLTGHFLSHITARLPYSHFIEENKLSMGALYLEGVIDDSEYHIQMTAIHSPNPSKDEKDAARDCPDYAASASWQQLKDSQKHVVFVCAVLGELNHLNQKSWVQKNKTADITTNVDVQLVPDETDKKLWNKMEEATFTLLENLATKVKGDLEYWHDENEYGNGTWKKDRPKIMRVPGYVHEASTLFMGDSDDPEQCVINSEYRPHGLNNVYVTGASLFPSSGSWNPTLTMCGFAQDLARKLVKNPPENPNQ